MTDPLPTRRVAVQGLGFVGAAMAIAVASALDDHGAPRYRVAGVDLGDEAGQARVDALNQARFPFATNDETMLAALAAAHGRGNLVAGTDPSVYGDAEVATTAPVSAPPTAAAATTAPRAQWPTTTASSRGPAPALDPPPVGVDPGRAAPPVVTGPAPIGGLGPDVGGGG